MTSTKRNRIWNDDGNRIEQGDVSGWDDDIDDDGGQGASGWGAGEAVAGATATAVAGAPATTSGGDHQLARRRLYDTLRVFR